MLGSLEGQEQGGSDLSFPENGLQSDVSPESQGRSTRVGDGFIHNSSDSVRGITDSTFMFSGGGNVWPIPSQRVAGIEGSFHAAELFQELPSAPGKKAFCPRHWHQVTATTIPS